MLNSKINYNWSKEDYILATNITRWVIYIGMILAVISFIFIIKSKKYEIFFRWILVEIFACILVRFPYIFKLAGGMECILGYSSYELQHWDLFLPTYFLYLLLQILLIIYVIKLYRKRKETDI